MNRSGQAVSALLAIIGVSKLLFAPAVGQLFALDQPVALIALAVSVIAFGIWYGPLRLLSGSSVTRFLGLTVLVMAAASVYSPTLLGLRGTYLPVADIFLLVESGILLQMIGLERKQPETLRPFLLLSNAVHRLSHTPRHIPATASSR